MKDASDRPLNTTWTQNPKILALIAVMTLAFFGLSSYFAWHTFGNTTRKHARYKKLSKPRWSDLTEMQREMLAPLAGEWNHISPSGKKTWLIIADRIALKSEKEKMRAQKRIQVWAKMTPEQRNTVRANYALAKKNLKSDEKMARWKNYQQLTQEQEQELANKDGADDTAPHEKVKNETQVARKGEAAAQEEADDSATPGNAETPDKAPAS